MNAAAQLSEEMRLLAESIAPEDPTPTVDLDNVRIPRITIDVFKETDSFAEAWQHVVDDRRMITTTTNVYEGGFPGAVKHYTTERTPDLIIVETDADEAVLSIEADLLAEVCDPNTRLIVVGHRNDINLYRKLIALGVSSYLVFPVTVTSKVPVVLHQGKQ